MTNAKIKRNTLHIFYNCIIFHKIQIYFFILFYFIFFVYLSLGDCSSETFSSLKSACLEELIRLQLFLFSFSVSHLPKNKICTKYQFLHTIMCKQVQSASLTQTRGHCDFKIEIFVTNERRGKLCLLTAHNPREGVMQYGKIDR